jgi:hypothetical protein
MPHSYAAEYPTGIEVDDDIKLYFEEFYKTSDTPDAHEKYADSFTKDATLVMASKKAIGRDGTVQLDLLCFTKLEVLHFDLFISLLLERERSYKV